MPRKSSGLSAWLQLVRTFNHMEAKVSADLRGDDLTLAQVDALVALSRHGPMSQQALAHHLFVTKGNIVGLIDRLSVRSFVERTPCKTDRRVNMLQITPRGRRRLERILPHQLELIASLMRPLKQREAVTLERLLARLTAGL
jgi:DNA-binding MarR family transcriptional regulator